MALLRFNVALTWNGQEGPAVCKNTIAESLDLSQARMIPVVKSNKFFARSVGLPNLM